MIERHNDYTYVYAVCCRIIEKEFINMAKVGIVMGSDSDLKVMSKAAEILEKFGIEYEMTIISAHRMPDVFFDYANKAQ